MSRNKKSQEHNIRRERREIRECKEQSITVIRMDEVCGIWKSYSIFPTLLIYKDHSKYKLCIMQTDELGQVQPEVYVLKPEIENEYTLIFSMRDITVKYNAVNDVLSHTEFGNYSRQI